jgi:hypothetical protein
LRRASAAGRVRPEVVAGDIPVIQIVLGTIIDMTSPVRPALRHRYAQLLLDGLEPHPGDAPLAGPAPTPQEGVRVVQTWRPSPRRPGARA